MKRTVALVIVATILSAVACNTPSDSTSSQKSSTPITDQPPIYHGAGLVKSMDEKRPSVEIDHGDIKDLMPAMTMDFYVKEKSLLEGLKPGDRIEFTIVNGAGGLKITEIRKQ